MTIIYVTENNCECYAVTHTNKECIKVQKFKDVSEDKNIIYEVNPMETFIGNSHLCDMTEFSGGRDRQVFNGNTILLVIGKENIKHKYVYIGAEMICSLLTNDKIYKYISIMGNNLSPVSIAIGFKNIYYSTPNLKNARKENIDIGDIDKLFDIDYVDIMNREQILSYKIPSTYD